MWFCTKMRPNTVYICEHSGVAHYFHLENCKCISWLMFNININQIWIKFPFLCYIVVNYNATTVIKLFVSELHVIHFSFAYSYTHILKLKRWPLPPTNDKIVYDDVSYKFSSSSSHSLWSELPSLELLSEKKCFSSNF